MAIGWPEVVLNPTRLPWHLPEGKNYNQGFFGWLVFLWKGIFIQRGSGNFLEKIPLLLELNEKSPIIVFPEGGRNKDPESGKVARFHKGASYFILAGKRQTVLPVASYGIQFINPYEHISTKAGLSAFRIHPFKRMVIVIGKPFTLDEYYNLPEVEARIKITAKLQLEVQKLYRRARFEYKKANRFSSIAHFLRKQWRKQISDQT